MSNDMPSVETAPVSAPIDNKEDILPDISHSHIVDPPHYTVDSLFNASYIGDQILKTRADKDYELEVNALKPVYQELLDDLLSGKLSKEEVAAFLSADRGQLKQLQEYDTMLGDAGIFAKHTLEKKLQYAESLCNRLNLPLTIAVMDLDDFSKVNDLGHELGDEAIKVFGGFIKRNVRDTDIVIRAGGDEFIVIFPGATTEQVQIRLEETNTVISSEMKEDPAMPEELKALNYSLSAGVATTSELTNQPVSKLIKMADNRSYISKGHGKGLIYTQDMGPTLPEHD